MRCFFEGVDNTISEMDLDDLTDWDFVISNENDEQLNNSLQYLLDYIENTRNLVV